MPITFSCSMMYVYRINNKRLDNDSCVRNNGRSKKAFKTQKGQWIVDVKELCNTDFTVVGLRSEQSVVDTDLYEFPL